MLILIKLILISSLGLCETPVAAATSVKSAKEIILSELETYGSRADYNVAHVDSAFERLGANPTRFDVQTWREATKLLNEEEALSFSALKSIVENTGRIQSPHGVLSPEKEAMLYTLRALLRRKLRKTKNRLPWTFLLGQTQFYLGQGDNFYLKYYLAKGKDPTQLLLAREMLAQINP